MAEPNVVGVLKITGSTPKDVTDTVAWFFTLSGIADMSDTEKTHFINSVELVINKNPQTTVQISFPVKQYDGESVDNIYGYGFLLQTAANALPAKPQVDLTFYVDGRKLMKNGVLTDVADIFEPGIMALTAKPTIMKDAPKKVSSDLTVNSSLKLVALKDVIIPDSATVEKVFSLRENMVKMLNAYHSDEKKIAELEQQIEKIKSENRHRADALAKLDAQLYELGFALVQ